MDFYVIATPGKLQFGITFCMNDCMIGTVSFESHKFIKNNKLIMYKQRRGVVASVGKRICI